MKKYLVVAFLLVAVTISPASAQSFSAGVNEKSRERVQRRPAPVYERPAVGAIPRAARGGNPIQMLNPRAPRRYFGPVNDTVTYDQDNPSRITGIIFFGLRW